MKAISHRPVVIVAALALSACSVAPPGTGIHDPYEQVNRAVHEFNKDVDSAFLRPAGQVAAALPDALTIPVSNFADNTALPGMVLNGILQADIEGVAVNTMRFVLNSTVGLLGLFDPAAEIGLVAKDTDFGETLAVWGVPEGAYVELPLLGPSTERDAVGQLVDFVIDPLDAIGNDRMSRWDTPAFVVDLVIQRGSFGETFDSVLYDSADSYAQTRLLYLQNRRFELGGEAEDAYVDPYADSAYIDPYEDIE